MAGEAEQQTTETPTDEDKEFLAAYAGEAPPEQTASEEPAAQEEPQEPVAETPAEPQPEYVQFTREEAERFRKSEAVLAGLQQELRSLRSIADRAHGMAGDVHKAWKEHAAAPAREVVIGDDDFAEANAAFGSDLVKALVPAVQRIVKRIPTQVAAPATAQATIDPEAIRQHVRAQQNAVELERLNEVYPDWRVTTDTAGTDPANKYRAWLRTKPAEYQDRLNRTSSGEMVKRSLDWFHADEERAARAPKPATAPAQRPAPQRVQPRPNRMRAAVPPNGNAASQAAQPSELDEMLRGFNGT